jgi:uncharacterized protein YuzE
MKIVLDTEVDAAYIYSGNFGDSNERGRVVETISLICDGLVNIDLDAQGVIVGVEVIPASKLLTTDRLKTAVLIGEHHRQIGFDVEAFTKEWQEESKEEPQS